MNLIDGTPKGLRQVLGERQLDGLLQGLDLNKMSKKELQTI